MATNKKIEVHKAELQKEAGDHPIATVTSNYLNSIKNIAQTINVVLPHLSKWWLEEVKKLEGKLEHFVPEPLQPGETKSVTLESARDFVEFTSILRQLDELRASRATPVLARSLFMQMFSEFDAFMGALLKVLYTRNGELLKGISREISLPDLLEFEDIDAVKRSMLEKEIETFRRDSYVEQFGQLEKKFNIPLKKFAEWGEFVELSQRRNIFTHNDGIVNDQYISVCDREGWSFEPRPKVGDALNVDTKYFGRALRVMSKVGFMLSFTLWSKVFPKEHAVLHTSLNNIIYKALEDKRWLTASELGAFALSEPMRKNLTEIDARIRIVNVAIAFKFAEQGDRAQKLLSSVDWSASYRDFKLALHVLDDKFEEAIELMRRIGKSGEILDQTAYHSWPLFHKFRERPEFYQTYEEIYGEPFSARLPQEVGDKVNVAAKVRSGRDTAAPSGGVKKVVTLRRRKTAATSPPITKPRSKPRAKKAGDV